MSAAEGSGVWSRPTRRRRRCVAVALAAVGLIAGCAGGSTGGGTSPAAADRARGTTASAGSDLQACPQVDAPAVGDNLLPDLTLPCLGPGSAVALRRLTGMPTVLNIWASWCPTCRDELPSFEVMSWQARDRLRVLGVVSEDSRQRAASFATDTGIHFPSLVDDNGRLLRAVGRRNLPTTLFVDRTGRVVEVYTGQPLTSIELRERVRERLGVDVG